VLLVHAMHVNRQSLGSWLHISWRVVPGTRVVLLVPDFGSAKELRGRMDRPRAHMHASSSHRRYLGFSLTNVFST
jgi:hypothetical protein